jgi:hypothetical protein
MRQYLPPIDISLRENPTEFLNKMAVIAMAANFKIERRQDTFGKDHLDILNMWFQGLSPHQGLGVQLISRSDLELRVAVEVRAQTWNPDEPTYDVYVSAAKDLVTPLLQRYNKQTGSRLRLRIPSQKQLVPRLTPHSERLFKRFAVLANTSSLHYLDWQRFYEFVHGSRTKALDETEMARLLMEHGFSREYAEHISSIYEHLVEFKSLC